MENQKLSVIVRNIILSNVIDNNQPLLLSYEIDSQKRSFQINSSLLQIIDNGIILIQNPSEELLNLTDKFIDISFDYNSVYLTFSVQLKKVKAGIAFVVPLNYSQKDVKKIEETNKKSIFSFILFYERQECVDGINFKNKCDVKCIVKDEYFSTKDDSIKNVMKYLTSKNDIQSDVPEIIYLDQEKIVLAFSKKLFEIEEKFEFAAWICFPLKRPLNERKIYVSFVIDNIFKGLEDYPERFCASGKISSIKLEDIRFLHEHFLNRNL